MSKDGPSLSKGSKRCSYNDLSQAGTSNDPNLPPAASQLGGIDESSGMDVSFQTSMKWMHSNDRRGSNDINVNAASLHHVTDVIEAKFPGALPVARVVNSVKEQLLSHDMFPDHTLLATSLCYDELNRGIEDEFASRYGQPFAMGGLAGFCFGGTVGFGNALHHAPGAGNVLLLYGPHVGVDMDGTVGKVNRPGQRGSSECCGPAGFCLNYCRDVHSGHRDAPTAPGDITASQQTWACRELLPYMDRIEAAAEASGVRQGENCDAVAVELPKCLYEAQDGVVQRILKEVSESQMNPGAHIALLGGITINTPDFLGEYFLPLKFVMVNDEGEVIKDMLADLLAAKPPTVEKHH